MKKTYIAPATSCTVCELQQMLATSIDVRNNTTIDAGDAYSHEKAGWDSSNWSAEDEE